jgi:hypothetical protein
VVSSAHQAARFYKGADMTGYQSKKAAAQDKLNDDDDIQVYQRTWVDLPNFAAWNHETLAKFALEAYLRMQAQQDAIEQLRGDLKDAMQLVRASTLPVND